MRASPTEKGDRDRAKKHGSATPPLRVDAANAQVWQGEHLLKLTPKAFAVLQYLLAHPGRLVTKDELMRTVWADAVVTDGALVACIRELRKVLQDDVQAPHYIDTVHRRGYRFIGLLAASPPSPSQKLKVESPFQPLTPRPRHPLWWAARPNWRSSIST